MIPDICLIYVYFLFLVNLLIFMSLTRLAFTAEVPTPDASKKVPGTSAPVPCSVSAPASAPHCRLRGNPTPLSLSVFM